MHYVLLEDVSMNCTDSTLSGFCEFPALISEYLCILSQSGDAIKA